jgi:exonuclease III
MRLAYLVELLPPQQPSVYQHPVGVVVNFYFNLKESEMTIKSNQNKKYSLTPEEKNRAMRKFYDKQWADANRNVPQERNYTHLNLGVQ